MVLMHHAVQQLAQHRVGMFAVFVDLMLQCPAWQAGWLEQQLLMMGYEIEHAAWGNKGIQ